MRRRGVGQCGDARVRAVHRRRSIPHAKHGFFDVQHLHIGRRCLVVEQGHHNRCNALAASLAVITVCVLAAAEKAAKLRIPWQ